MCRQNAYLRKKNKELFEPRGLRCLIFAFDPNNDQVLDEGNTTSMSLPKYQRSDGTMGVGLPPCANLIYPDPYEGIEKKPGLGSAISDKVSRTIKEDGAKDDVKAQIKYVSCILRNGGIAGWHVPIKLVKNPDSPLQPLLDPKAILSEKDLAKQEKEQNKIKEKKEKEDHKRQKKEEEQEKKRSKRKEQGKEEKPSNNDSHDDKSKEKKNKKVNMTINPVQKSPCSVCLTLTGYPMPDDCEFINLSGAVAHQRHEVDLELLFPSTNCNIM